MLTKGAIGNLINRYKAVLTKCNLINTFGSLAVASMLVLGGVTPMSAQAAFTSIENSVAGDYPVSVTEDTYYKYIQNYNGAKTTVGDKDNRYNIVIDSAGLCGCGQWCPWECRAGRRHLFAGSPACACRSLCRRQSGPEYAPDPRQGTY